MPDDDDDAAEFERFVLDHGGELLAFARRLTLDHHRAEDVVQDVLARLGMSWHRVRVTENVRSYAFRSVLNRFLSWKRRLASGELVVGRAIGADQRVENEVEGQVLRREGLRAAMAELSAPQRAVLVLRYYQDLPDGEIARLTGYREATVRSHARRALTILRDRFGSEEFERRWP